jgi:hypothetical protein
MSKLTLSVDDNVITRAKKYAKIHNVSVSEMVETYLTSVVFVYNSQADPPATPVLRSMRGLLKNAEIEDYREHLANKYR